MLQEASLLFEDDISRAGHELFEPLDRIATPVDQIADIKDPRMPSIVLPRSPTASEEPHSAEQPKVATSQRRNDAFFQSLIHMPAIVMTLGALSLNFRGVFWQAPTSYTNTVLNILQFVAKLHEFLMIFSLTAIVFHRLRYEIIARNGIPFGLLSAALQYSSPQALTRKDLRQILVSPRQFRRYKGPILLVILAFVLSLISGPSAAIAILPRLEWWPVPASHNTSSPAYPPIIYLNTSVFPNVVTFPPQTSCNSDDTSGYCSFLNQCSANTTNILWCHSSGLDTILYSGLVKSLLLSDGALPLRQISMSSADRLGEISPFSRSLNGNLREDTSGNSVFVASVIPDVVAVALGWFWQVGNQNESLTRPMAKTSSPQAQAAGLQKPLVQVQCTASNNTLTNSTSDVVSFPSTFHHPKVSSNISWTVPLAGLLDNTTTITDLGYYSYEGFLPKWVNLNMPEDISPSATALFSLPIGYGHRPPKNTFACTIDAMWIPSESWIDPTTDDKVHESITNPLQEQHHFKEGSGKIQLSQSWLDILNVQYALSTTDKYTSLEAIASRCFGGNDELRLAIICLESVLALYIADGLARRQCTTSHLWNWQGVEDEYYTADVFLCGESEGSPVSVQVLFKDSRPRFTINVLQYGYGYGFQDSKTIYFATIILIIYVLVALIHMAILIIGGWSSDVWRKPGELIALAVNSSPTELLQNTCAGIEDPKVWRHIVSVKETGENHLGIVFEEVGGVAEGKGANSIETQERQSDLKGFESGLRRRVIPGKTYGTIASRPSPTVSTQVASATPPISVSYDPINK